MFAVDEVWVKMEGNYCLVKKESIKNQNNKTMFGL